MLRPRISRVWLSIIWLLGGTLGAARGQAPELKFVFDDQSHFLGRLVSQDAADVKQGLLKLHQQQFAESLKVDRNALLEAVLQQHASNYEVPAAQGNQIGVVVTQAGNRYVGTIQSGKEGRLTIRTQSVGVVELPQQEVAQIYPVSRLVKDIYQLRSAKHRVDRSPQCGFTQQGLVLHQPQTWARMRFDLPDRFRLRLQVSASADSDWELLLGDWSLPVENLSGTVQVGSVPRSPQQQQMTSVQVCQGSVSLVRSNASVSDAAAIPVQTLQDASGQNLDVDLYVDQVKGTLIAAVNGKQVAAAELQDQEPVRRQELTLLNHGDTLVVKGCLLSHWDGERLPTAPLWKQSPSDKQSLTQPCVLTRDGHRLYGSIRLTDQGSLQIQEQTIKWNQIWQVNFPADQVEPFGRIPSGATWTLKDGCRVTGTLIGVDQERFVVQTNMTTPRKFTVGDVIQWSGRPQQITSPQGSDDPGVQEKTTARLISSDLALLGHLHDDLPGQVGFQFQPAIAAEPVRLSNDSEWRIDFLSPQPESTSNAAETIHLRDGQRIKGKVAHLQPSGLQLDDSLFGTRSLPPAAVGWIDFLPADPLDPAAWNLAISLPRNQRQDPPAHLLASANGDLLRGSVSWLDQTEVIVGIRGQRRSLSRKFLSRLIFVQIPAADLTRNEFDDPKPKAFKGITVWTADGDLVQVQAATVHQQRLQLTHRLFGQGSLPLKDIRCICFGNPGLPRELEELQQSAELVQGGEASLFWQPMKQPRDFETLDPVQAEPVPAVPPAPAAPRGK